jgi:hypothetical protein
MRPTFDELVRIREEDGTAYITVIMPKHARSFSVDNIKLSYMGSPPILIETINYCVIEKIET